MADYSSDCDMPGQRALVTGGSRGLGFAIARHLARAGWQVTIASRSYEQLVQAQQRAQQEDLHLHIAELDVTCETSVCDLFAAHGSKQPFTLCVNNAGKNFSRLLVRPTDSGIRTYGLTDWEETISLCLTGVFLCGREAAAHMVRHAIPGTIINIASGTWRGAYAQSAYAAAKAGVVSLTRSWALELADYGIRVVAVSPGVMEGAALVERCAEHHAHAAYMEVLRTHVPLRRWAREEEVAQAVGFAANNGYLTGTVLEIDGGGVPGRIWSQKEGNQRVSGR